MRGNNAAALMEVLADDVVFYPPGEEAARGKPAVRAWYEGVIAEATTDAVNVPEREVVVSGDWGVEQGKYVWKLAPVGDLATGVGRGSWTLDIDGELVSATFKFADVFRRESDGSWKCAHVIWNADTPAA